VRSSPAVAIAAIVLAVLLAAEVARLTVSSAVANDNPHLALRLAPGAPEALASSAMAGVGQAAANGIDPDEATFRRLRAVAASDPLRTEPFLVEGAMAEKAGAYDRAKQLLVQARSRDPRSAAARYLYADTAVRQGRLVEGLEEMAVLSRLVPGAAIQLVPALAQFAQTPGSHDKLAGILAQNPQLKNPLLIALATNPDNANLIIALAGPPSATPTNDTRAWQTRLLMGLVARGEYRRAYELWRGFARLPAGAQPLLFNGGFRPLGAPAPFNWDFGGSKAGIAEPGNGQLRVLYYGRQDAQLAAQLLILSPGTYRFAAPTAGNLVAGALSWRLSCLGASVPLMDVQLGTPVTTSATFTVPANGCPAQQLQLNGHLEDSPEDSDVRLGPAIIERVGR
jgi:tetratricopeptide (TPR) repeat protein